MGICVHMCPPSMFEKLNKPLIAIRECPSNYPEGMYEFVSTLESPNSVGCPFGFPKPAQNSSNSKDEFLLASGQNEGQWSAGLTPKLLLAVLAAPLVDLPLRSTREQRVGVNQAPGLDHPSGPTCKQLEPNMKSTQHEMN